MNAEKLEVIRVEDVIVKTVGVRKMIDVDRNVIVEVVSTREIVDLNLDVVAAAVNVGEIIIIEVVVEATITEEVAEMNLGADDY